jgi:hypothetical protein
MAGIIIGGSSERNAADERRNGSGVGALRSGKRFTGMETNRAHVESASGRLRHLRRD